ncbi:MAG: YHYH protein [Oleispira sp.]
MHEKIKIIISIVFFAGVDGLWGGGQSESEDNDTGIGGSADLASWIINDVDVCGGHAAQGDYHHHFYTHCLADLVADDGSQHSPIYGFSADGYPLYGPYEDDGSLALSGWEIRD